MAALEYRPGRDALRSAADTIRPPMRRRVSETAVAVVRVESAGGAPRPWSADETPYMVEPMDLLESREYQAVVFVAPAQCGKTQALIDCWMAHVITASPSDMMVIQATQSVARDYERDRFRKLKRLSSEIASKLGKGHDDNIYDKTLLTGDTIELKWPSENELQGKSRRRMALTDYDRMPLDIGGQGAPFELARKRTRKFRSLAMTLVESSPGHEQSDPQWRPSTPHDAPPAVGIMSLYRLGDRRRLYWPCPHCGDYFMSPPGPDGFVYEVEKDANGRDIPESVKSVRIACPLCGGLIDESERPEMLRLAKWVPDYCIIDRNGRMEGGPPRTDIASYWLHGVHAAYTTWRQLVYSWLQARSIFDATGDEQALRTVVMQDFGAPYVSQARERTRKPTQLEGRKEPSWKIGTVPDGVRWLTACIDTQAQYWSVMIVGRGVGGERWIVDRFEVRDSARVDAYGHHEAVDPAGYIEDWDLLTEQVLCRTYPLIAHPGRRLAVRMTLIDSGGAGHAGNPGVNVTSRANAWFRRLRAQGLSHRVALTKGTGTRPDSRGQLVTESYPDNSGRANRHSGAAGDVPLYRLHVNALKDALDADLKREVPGPGYVHIPDDIPSCVLDELTSEIRTETGWEIASSGGARNEAWDQLVMEMASTLLPQDRAGIIRSKDPRVRFAVPAARIDWSRPPPWATPMPDNSEVDLMLSPTAPGERQRTPSATAAAFRAF